MAQAPVAKANAGHDGLRSIKNPHQVRGDTPLDGSIDTGLKHSEVFDANGGAEGEPGFLTTDGDFLSRKAAVAIAIHAGQAMVINNPMLGLSSTDLVKNYPPCES